MTHPQSYAPQHARPGPTAPPPRRTARLVAIVVVCLAGLAAVGTGAWFVLNRTFGSGADLDEFCTAADAYFGLAGQQFDDPERTREFVTARVENVDLMLRRAPPDIGPTVADYAADVQAGARVFERYSYAPDLIDKALAGTLAPPEDAVRVLRLAGYSYTGDTGGQRGGEIVAYRDSHCQRAGT